MSLSTHLHVTEGRRLPQKFSYVVFKGVKINISDVCKTSITVENPLYPIVKSLDLLSRNKNLNQFVPRRTTGQILSRPTRQHLETPWFPSERPPRTLLTTCEGLRRNKFHLKKNGPNKIEWKGKRGRILKKSGGGSSLVY